jgi:molybdopterin converting factor subunit 1
MYIRVVYFALLRERLGAAEEPLEVAAGATVLDAMAQLCTRHEALAGMTKSLLIAVNQALVPTDFPLHDGDELALLPPVSGGSANLPRCRLSAEPLVVQEVIDAVSGPEQGGLVLFCGLVRDHNLGKQIVRLDYEAYDGMAVRAMTQIADAIIAEHEQAQAQGQAPAGPGVRIAMVHRTGSLRIGEVAVIIAASAPHRAEAFAACRSAIERLKKEVPIWKKEFSSDGSEWLGGAG